MVPYLYKGVTDINSIKWGFMPQYQTDVLIVHFNYDGRAALELEDRSRKLNKTVMIKQVAGRQGLSVFVFDVSIEEFPTLISGLPKY